MACHVICARAADSAVRGDHLDAPAALSLRPRIFEGNQLPHLLFLHALRRGADLYSTSPQILAGARWPARVQKPGGTFERGWSLAEGNAIFRAAHALSTVRERLPLPPSAADAVDHTLGRTADHLPEPTLYPRLHI
ncbi:hypothetical protein R6L23_01660 [Streptomyces sp. SR27]|uniref:hypothetical protein n=1 Tax=Streptomyces sp. SR27 TaxID=3076630 RepID=UPI00295C1F60|nr:hypothetical protein [Streptomyces sp. SR27]MDV9186942.1 hypothetical protein [Streptomyces sp. SR27]